MEPESIAIRAVVKQKIKQILSQRERKRISVPGLSPAAVLIPIYENSGEHYILFTKRTERVGYHKGQISFPGGAKSEEDETLLATALRESFEEVGLRPEAVEILGELDEERTISSNFVISPFVAFIPYPYRFKISEAEVEDLVEVPISALLNRANFREEVEVDGGRTFPSYFYYYGDKVIWGATARILKNFLDLVFGQG
jgi:8-oxo-dGTP pyrophosphatase MutT (NUDIX family)